MARVNVDSIALHDPRFDLLAKLAGYADGDHARGKMLRIWNLCTERETDVPQLALIAIELGLAEDVARDSLVAAELASPESDGQIRIRGCTGRTEWLAARRKAAQKGGLAKAAKGRGLAAENRKQNSADARPQKCPPAPAPAPAPALDPPISPTGDVTGCAGDRCQSALELPIDHEPEVRVTLDPPPATKRQNGAAKRKRDRAASLEVTEATTAVLEVFNRRLQRDLAPRLWTDTVSKALKAGFNVRQMIAVVHWVANEWGEDLHAAITPKTLLKLQSSQGKGTLPEYLSQATEAFKRDNPREAVPWEDQ
jgi:hypothetical protein